MIKDIGLIYILLYFSVALHEISHMIISLIIWRSFKKIVIGIKFLSINIGKLRISPIIGESYVLIDSEKIANSSKTKVLCFYLAGIITNIIISVVCLTIGGFVFYAIFIANIILIIVNVLPFCDSDIHMIIKLTKRG